MMDNLVRLKYHRDPNPGESRSFQLCTLPLTVKGIPTDSDQVAKWHDSQVCNESDYCFCKADANIDKATGMSLLLDQNDEESMSRKNFDDLVRWTFLTMWPQIIRVSELMHWIQMQPEVFETHGNVMTESDSNETYEPKGIQRPYEAAAHDTGAETATSEIEMSLQSIHIESDDESSISSDDFHKDNTSDGIFRDIKVVPEHDSFFDDFQSGDNNYDCTELELQDILGQLNLDTELLKPVDEVGCELLSEDSDKFSVEKMLLTLFGFEQYHPPVMITRHPPPATGRDDDIWKLKEILDNFLIRTGYITTANSKHRILVGADNKIGKNVLQLMKNDSKYRVLLPEFPLLHLRKSKITNLFSGYKEAGIVHMLKYMKDADQDEWMKLLTAENIDAATRTVWRISMSLHLAFFIKFVQQLSVSQQTNLLENMVVETEDN